MASTGNPLNDFILTPQQQSLLFAALNSNKQATDSTITNSPAQNDPNAFQESPFLDYDNYDFNGDTSFDFSFADGTDGKMIGDLPGSAGSAASGKAGSDNNDTEKRSHPDDENEEEEGNAKRQETGEKVPKKPGRKPLTTEPSSVCSFFSRSSNCRPKQPLTMYHPQCRSEKHRTELRNAPFGNARRNI